MAGFRFKFQAVLEQRQLAEDHRQRELAKVMRQRMILQNQLRQMQQTIGDSKRDLAGSLVGTVDMAQVSQFARYSGQVTQRAQSLVVRLAALEGEIESARQQLLVAAKARKTLELLRDRYHEQWRRAENRREDAELDELAAQPFARRVVETGEHLGATEASP